MISLPSAGSLIVDCQFVLDDHTYLTAVSDLISSLADLAFTSITIGNYSGNVVITVKGTSGEFRYGIGRPWIQPLSYL